MKQKINPKNAIRDMTANYREFVSHVDDALLEGVKKGAQIVLDRALPITPIDTGALRQSGRVGAEKRSDGEVGVVSYGGDYRVTPTKNAPNGYVTYAASVHEDLTKNFHVGGPKFLERAAQQSTKDVTQAIIDSLSKVK